MARSPQVWTPESHPGIFYIIPLFSLNTLFLSKVYKQFCSPLFYQTAAGYTIPVGHQVCVSPTVNHRLCDTWDKRLEFNPDRYLDENLAAGEKFAYVPFGAGKKKI